MTKKKIIFRRVLYAFLLIFVIGSSALFYIGDKVNNGERNAISLLKDKISGVEEPINLMICWTPLQMVIAERIIDQNPSEKFYTIVMSHSAKNEKYEHYSQKLAKKSERFYSFYIHPQSQNSWFVYTTLLELKLKSLLFPEVKTIYFAHINSPEVHTIVSNFPKSEIKTFDDGTANLVEKSAFLNDQERISTGEVSRVFYETVINSTHSTIEVREKSVEHFTIFKDLPNVMENVSKKITYLPLFDTSKLSQNNDIHSIVKIMLGSVDKKLKQPSEKAIKQFGIKYTTLHPRQTYRLNNAITLESNLIIEDYLLQEIEKNPHTQYEIYTFFSGAALTMKDFPNVKVFVLKPNSFPSKYWLTPVYDLFKQAKIPIIEFDDKD